MRGSGGLRSRLLAPSPRGLSWAAVLIALAALAVALSSAAAGRSGKTNTPRAYALVTGPGQVAKRFSHHITSNDVTVNNGAFCIRGVGFKPTHVQVTARSAPTFPQAILNDHLACQGGTAITFGNLTYNEKFLVALWG